MQQETALTNIGRKSLFTFDMWYHLYQAVIWKQLFWNKQVQKQVYCEVTLVPWKMLQL